MHSLYVLFIGLGLGFVAHKVHVAYRLRRSGYILLYVYAMKFFRWLFPYRYDKRNPFRRYCKTCGQQEEMYSSGNSMNSPAWWEVMYPLAKDPCKRHSDKLGDPADLK